MSARGACADCDPSSASTASVSSDLHKYHVACSCGNNAGPNSGAQYAECAPTGPGDVTTQKIERPPALPPRPPPRPRPNSSNLRSGETPTNTQTTPPGPRKYVWWCMGMGMTAGLLGALLMTAAFILRTLTTSLHHLETIPTPIPATMLVLTGLCIMSLARRRNRYSYLIKVVGACCLVCALTCVLVTITTTVIHMNRLQTLRQCFYTDETKTCICSSILIDNHNNSDEESEALRCVFEDVSSCDAIHGSLYRCLSAIFGISVAGVLVCICSAMLAYQLLSHERKKMYWEQLELRCRSLYRPTNTGQSTRSHTQQPQVCGECCTQCRVAVAANWDLQQRFWASGRVGNLYSPNPGTGRRVSPWSWFPWTRNSNQRVGGGSSGDSAYGFGNSPSGYWQLGPPPPYTPHHRYLHHHSSGSNSSHHHLHHSHSPVHMPHGCSMMNQSNRPSYPNSLTPHGSISDLESQHIGLPSHHHHHGSLRMGIGICHQSNQIHSPVRVLQCHDPNTLLSLSAGHFIPITDNERQNDESMLHRVECHHQSNTEDFSEKLEDIHHSQHTCQKHGQCSDEEPRSNINAQGEENLAFQCEKQSPSRPTRSGESELYFADVSSCCNVSLKTVEYCAGLVGTIETQADTSSGDSDVGSCPAFKGRPPRPRINHSLLSNFHNTNSLSPHSNNIHWKKQNSPSLSCSSANKIKKKNSPILSEIDSHIQANSVSQSKSNINSNHLQCHSAIHYQEHSACYGCTDPSCSDFHNSMNENQSIVCKMGQSKVENKTNTNMNNNANSSHNDSNHDSSFDHKLSDEIHRSSLRVTSSPNRSSLLHSITSDTDLNDVGLPLISQKKKNVDESLVIINNNLNPPHNKRDLNESPGSHQNISLKMIRKHLDESITETNRMSPLRKKGIENSNLNNETNISLSSSKRKCIDESFNLEESNSSASSHTEKDELVSRSPLKRRNHDESHFSREDNSVTSMRRRTVDDSLSSSNSTSSSPFRRICIDDSSISDFNTSSNSTKLSLDEMVHNNNPNVSGIPLKRKNVENATLNNQIENNIRIPEENILNKDLNMSLRRKSIEDSLNLNVAAMKRKGIDESLLLSGELNNPRPIRGHIFNDFDVVNDRSSRRKCVDEALLLLNEHDVRLSLRKQTNATENILNSQNESNVAKLNFVHMMQHNARYSSEFVDLNEPSLATESEGSRRGIVGGVCIAPDLRYEPVPGFSNDIPICENNVNPLAPVHMRCYSDSNTMDSGWQSGSEKHATD